MKSLRLLFTYRLVVFIHYCSFAFTPKIWSASKYGFSNFEFRWSHYLALVNISCHGIFCCNLPPGWLLFKTTPRLHLGWHLSVLILTRQPRNCSDTPHTLHDYWVSQKKVNRFEIRIIQYYLLNFWVSTLKNVESVIPYWLNTENRFSKGRLFQAYVLVL